jgi:hypothetical protein
MGLYLCEDQTAGQERAGAARVDLEALRDLVRRAFGEERLGMLELLGPQPAAGDPSARRERYRR